MTDFLLELLCEEIPARMQDKAREDLARLFSEQLAAAGIKPGAMITFATPRRLALIARDLPTETEAVSEETKGPKVGAPPQALEGFLRKTGLTQEQLVERDGIYFAVIDKPGRATADVIAEAIPAIIRAFPWPKSMRWGAASRTTESLRWVRPLQGIVALFGDDVVPFSVDGVASGAATVGHRFMHQPPFVSSEVEGREGASSTRTDGGVITIGNAGDYAEKLRACHVIVDQEERRAIIRERAKALAADKGLVWIEDEALVRENAGLTEWPVPLIGDFDPAFLDVPPEVIRLTLATNQKYFVCQGTDGKLAPAFICTANIEAKDGGEAIVAGNRKVLAARLSDARFFWEQDQRTPLVEHAKKLERITFHEKLGTVADKVDRVAKLARWLVEEGIVTERAPAQAGAQADVSTGRASLGSGLRRSTDLADMAEQAARLAKADLVTEMVGEFPELQGVMGGYYAAREGLNPQVAAAIRDHYKPVGQGDEVPTAPVTVAVSLADKLDTLVTFFGEEMRPTGSKDPFALRRAALSALSLITINGLRLPLRASNLFEGLNWYPSEVGLLDDALMEAIRKWASTARAVVAEQQVYQDERIARLANHNRQLLDFFADRLKVQQKEAGVRHDLIDAVFALGGEDDLVRLLARVKALQAFVGTEDGANLLAGYKRAANLLKQAEDKSSPGRGGGSDAVADGGGSPSGAAVADSPLHHPSDGPPPRSGEELALLTALDAAEPKATAAVDAEDFAGAMAALASLRAPVDAFFDAVMVNDPDPAKRAFRLGLLARVRDAVHAVADFSKIEG